MAKSKKNESKPKLNLTVREEQRNKLEQMASLARRIAKRGHAYPESLSALSLNPVLNWPHNRECQTADYAGK